MEIKVFSTPSCPICHTLKNYLKEKGFEFEEVDVSHDQKEREELMEKTGQATLPIIEINQQFIAGFDKKKIDGILGIKG